MSAFATWVLAKEGSKSRNLFRRSLNINRNSEIALTLAGRVDAATGDPPGGRALIEEASRLNNTPPMPWIALGGIAFSYLVEGAYENAVIWAENSLAHNDRFAIAKRMLIVALVQSGELAKARQFAAEILQVEPRTTVSEVVARLPYVAEEVVDTYRESFRQTNIPE